MASDDQWLESEIRRLATLIDAAVREDTRKQFSNDVFDEKVSFLVSFARERSAFVLQEIAKLR
jgi:hypothetical protein